MLLFIVDMKFIYLISVALIFFLQGFYIYIYTVSIIFLIYAYVYLLRNKSLKLRRNLRRNQYSSPSSGSRSNLKRKYSFDDSRTYHTGSFYLRLGAAGRQIHFRIFWFANKWYVQKNKEFWLYFVIYLRSFTLYYICISILVRFFIGLFTNFKIYLRFWNRKHDSEWSSVWGGIWHGYRPPDPPL